jgi:hypothetical protein
MWGFLDGLFGSAQSSKSSVEINQLFEIVASFQVALLSKLKEKDLLSDEDARAILHERNELMSDIRKTYLIDEWDHYGAFGDRDEPERRSTQQVTGNTWDAIFALLNNQMDTFCSLIEEGPSKEIVEQHEKDKQHYADVRKKHLDKQKACEHVFKASWPNKSSSDKCIKCLKKHDSS